MDAPAGRPRVEVRRAEDRGRTQLAWLDSRHSFSFGRHYDPGNASHGVLLVNNDERIATGAGFDDHLHRDVEIVTWVLEGSLLHEDSSGNRAVVAPGLAQRMSAGRGVVHSERNDAYRLDADRPREQVRVVQMWVLPDESGTDPGYEQLAVDDRLRHGELVPLASGLPAHRGAAALGLGTRHAALHAARLQPGQGVQLPDAPFLHVFVARGAAVLESLGALGTADAVRLTATGGRRVTATEPAEVLVWEMHADLRGPA